MNSPFLNQLQLRARRSSGKNSHGHTTSFHRGGGKFTYCRLIDFKRHYADSLGIVRKIFSDLGRSGHVALVCYETGTLSYLLAAQYLQPGDSLKTIGEGTVVNNFKITFGTAGFLNIFSIGTNFFNVSLFPKCDGQLARSAGTSCKLLKRSAHGCFLRLPSGKTHFCSMLNQATFGVVSNRSQKNQNLQKAGTSRLFGRRPTVRGVAMNPVDHPHGGNTSGGRHCSTPWGVLTKGYKTVRRR